MFQHVGCPHGCGDSRRDPSSDFIRSQGLLLLAQLHRISSKYFRSFLRQMFTSRYSLVEVIDFLHALVGFCVDPGFVLSPISQFHSTCSTHIYFYIFFFRLVRKDDINPNAFVCTGHKRNSRLGVDPGLSGMNYAPNFSSPRTTEGHVINCIFKPFVTRLTASLKFLKSSENVVSFFIDPFVLLCIFFQNFLIPSLYVTHRLSTVT